MSILSLTKQYSDLSLLFKADFDIMLDELEAKVNGSVDGDNLNQDWATLAQVELAKDVSFTIGATDSCTMRFYTSDSSWGFMHETTMRNVFFKIDTTTVCTLDSSGDLTVTKDIYFYNKSTTYPLSYLIGYSKPVLVYSDSTTVNVEQNTTTANETLILFPVGPIAVTENVASTHKFRQLKLSATANGYSSSHTGAADSGLKVGVSLTANTWYFVYAVVVQGGDDAGNNFVLVVDTTNPTPTNWSSLNTAYGTGKWVYLGLLRYGHGEATTTTLVPFIADKSGWTMFSGRAAVDNLFGVRVDTSTVTTAENVYTGAIANSGNAVPANCSALQLSVRLLADADDAILAYFYLYDGTTRVATLPSMANNLSGAEPHGYTVKLPNVTNYSLRASTSGFSSNDYVVTTYISGVLDESR